MPRQHLPSAEKPLQHVQMGVLITPGVTGHHIFFSRRHQPNYPKQAYKMETRFGQKTKLCLHIAQLNEAYFLSIYSYSLLNLSFGKEQGCNKVISLNFIYTQQITVLSNCIRHKKKIKNIFMEKDQIFPEWPLSLFLFFFLTAKSLENVLFLF